MLLGSFRQLLRLVLLIGPIVLSAAARRKRIFSNKIEVLFYFLLTFILKLLSFICPILLKLSVECNASRGD